MPFRKLKYHQQNDLTHLKLIKELSIKHDKLYCYFRIDGSLSDGLHNVAAAEPML